jgi:hypothetical protein
VSRWRDAGQRWCDRDNRNCHFEASCSYQFELFQDLRYKEIVCKSFFLVFHRLLAPDGAAG